MEMDRDETAENHESESAMGPEEIVGEWLVECREVMVAVGLRFFGDEELANEMAQQACLVAMKRVRNDPSLVRIE